MSLAEPLNLSCFLSHIAYAFGSSPCEGQGVDDISRGGALWMILKTWYLPIVNPYAMVCCLFVFTLSATHEAMTIEGPHIAVFLPQCQLNNGQTIEEHKLCCMIWCSKEDRLLRRGMKMVVSRISWIGMRTSRTKWLLSRTWRPFIQLFSSRKEATPTTANSDALALVVKSSCLPSSINSLS